jgi:hypothetical protein
MMATTTGPVRKELGVGATAHETLPRAVAVIVYVAPVAVLMLLLGGAWAGGALARDLLVPNLAWVITSCGADAFGAGLREQVDLGAVSKSTLATVAQVIEPSGVALWLRSGRGTP